ncbi:MAG: hypothetical protein DRJ67_09690 [Thermoprotei archaeon]|nr:MAG: hypothetical protein DRJ67_09690 [Thermoprotei archaeon]
MAAASRYDELVERIARRVEEALASPRIVRVERVEPVAAPNLAVLYGVPVYLIGGGYAGQLRRFYYMRHDGGRLWVLECARYISIYGRRGDMLVPVVLCGFPTQYAGREYEAYYIEERGPFRTVECDERDIVNLERVERGEDPILIIDRHGLYRRGVPQDWWAKYVELQEMVRHLQETVYDLERDRSELLTNLRMREAEIQVLREEIERLRMQHTKLRAEVGSWYIEYLRLKSEVKVQQEVADLLEEMFRRLAARIRELGALLAGAKEAAPKVEERGEEREREEAGGGG